jgi:hypothetical protein
LATPFVTNVIIAAKSMRQLLDNVDSTPGGMSPMPDTAI